MSKTGDDCRFFYSSTCTKGDSCPFRHVEAARNSAVVCNFWKQKNCTKIECPYRHSNINSKAVPCYWENQPNGCTKGDCVFQHFKPHPDQGGQASSGSGPVLQPIIVNPAEDSSDMDSPKKRPPNPNVQTSDGNQDAESSGVQQIAVIIQPTRSNQLHKTKTFGQSNMTPWKKSPFQQHMHKQQLMQQRKRQFQQRQQHHLQRQVHQNQQEQKSTTSQNKLEDDVSQSDKQQQQKVSVEPPAQAEIKKTEKEIVKKTVPSHSGEKKASSSASVAPVKKVVRLGKDPKKEQTAAPEPKKELPKIKKIIKKVVNSSDDEAATDELGIKSLEQTLRERALRSMGIVEIIVKKDENKQSDKDGDSEHEENDVEENSGSEKEENDENEEESEEEQSVEEEAESEEEAGSEEEEQEEEAESEEAEEEDDLQDPEEIEILPVDDVDQVIGVSEEQDDGEAKKNEGGNEDTRKAVKKVYSTHSKKDKSDSKKRDLKRDKLKKKQTEKQGILVGKSDFKRTVLDRLGNKIDSSSSTSDKSERAHVGARKSGNIIKLRRSSKSREELKLTSKNRIRPEENDIPSSAIGSTNSGTIRITSRVGERNIGEKPVGKSASQSSNIKSRLGWNRPSDRASDTPSETSEHSDSETQKISVKNRIGWKNRDNNSENDDIDHPVNKDMKRKHSKSRKSRKKDKKDRFSEEYDSSEPSDSDSESELREKARKLKKLIDFDSDTIEDILRARERKKKSKSKKKRRKREEENEASYDSDVSQEGDQRKATFSKSRERNVWESKKRTGFVDEDLDIIPVIPNKVPASKHTGITFQVKNYLASSRQFNQFTADNSDSDEDNSKSNQLQNRESLKRGWIKSSVKEDEAQNIMSDEAKKPKINRIQWGTDGNVDSNVARLESNTASLVRPVAKSNTSWSTRAPGNVRVVTESKMQQIDGLNEEKVKRVQIKSLEEIRKEKAKKYASDDSSSEELDPMEALRQKFNVKSSEESVRQKTIDAKRRARQAQQIYVPPPRKRTVQLAFDGEDVSNGKKERVSSPVESQTENRKRVSPVQFDLFDNKAQSSSKAEVKTFAEIMAEKRARAKQLRDQSSTGENLTQSDKSTKSFRPIVFDIDTGASKSVSPMNRIFNTDRVSPVPATTAVNIEKDHQDEGEKSHKSHKHHHKSKKEKRRWRKKRYKMSPEEDTNSRDAAVVENSTSNFSADQSSSIFTAVHDESSGSPKAVFSSVTDDKSSSLSQSGALPVLKPVNEPEVTETLPEELPTKTARPSDSDNWLDFDFGEDLDVSKGDNKDDDDLLREIDELLA